jgi:hypothetical protein
MPPSPSNLTVCAIWQMVKGYELVINSAILLVKENQDLCTAINHKSCKYKRSTTMVKSKGSLTVEEAQTLVSNKNQPLT